MKGNTVSEYMCNRVGCLAEVVIEDGHFVHSDKSIVAHSAAPLLVSSYQRALERQRRTPWRQPESCDNCPFNTSGSGRQLRRSLDAGRWEEIIDGIRNDEAFFCHKTTFETGDGTNLICAGALHWQHRHGVSSNLERVMERLDVIYNRK